MGVISLLTVGILGVVIWFTLALRPVDHDSTKTITYTLVAGTGVTDIGDQLETKGLIRSSTAFVGYVNLKGLHSKLQAGTYDLSPSDSSQDIAEIVAGGHVAANKFLVPEGITIAKLKLLADERGIPTADFNDALSASYPNDFLTARPPGSSLEGYLFPDSYELIKPIRAKALVQSMLDNFAKKVSSTDIAQSYASMGLSLHQGVTLASIVEKEVPGDADRAMVAQVFINRLKAGQPLQSDVTVIYASALAGTDFNLSVDSKYNTYRYKGLPPGPIASPSLSAMKAVAHPTPNDYLYFLADKQGKTHFAKTLAEHEANVQKYLR